MKSTHPLLVIIEDNDHVAKSVALLSNNLGFNTEHYATANDFLATTTTTITPQIILLDLGLPDNDGISLLDHIQHHFASSQIIIMSGMDQSIIHAAEQLIQTRGLLLLGSLHKPFHFKALKTLLTSVRGERRRKARPPQDKSQHITPQLLRNAVTQQQFVPFYQAQTTSHEGKLVGFEALMRWIHPQWGTVSPDRFIHLASQYNLLDGMTWTMLEQVARHWQKLQWHDITVSVNLTASFLDQKQLPEKLIRLISRYELPPSQLMLEITESEALQDIPQQLKNLIRLRLAGFPLSIDDFGTGYSSLISLYQIPFHELKIDQTFVMRADNDPIAMEIIHTLVFLANRLDIHLIAEGVETENIHKILTEAGVERIQGYLIHQPMPFDTLQAWREQYHPVALTIATKAAILPPETLSFIIQQTLPTIDKKWAKELVQALHMRKNTSHFRPIFSSIFASGTSLTDLLALLLRGEWLLLQQAMPQIQQLPTAEQYHAIRHQLDFFDPLHQLAVEVNEEDWQCRLEQSENKAHKEHLDRILAENSVAWLRQGKIKLTAYLDEVPVQAIVQVIDIIGRNITVKLNEELAKVLSIDNYRAIIITCDNREQISVEMLKTHNGAAHLLLGNICANKIGLRHYVRVRHPDQPEVTLTIKGQPDFGGHIIDISISGIKIALPPSPTKIPQTPIGCTFTLKGMTINGSGTLRWQTRDQDNHILCGIALSTNADHQRLLQEETLRLQRDLVIQLNNSKLPVILRNALDEITD
ncbi:MAG: EAL domain-containing response regulator [Mariprofundales bacterium]